MESIQNENQFTRATPVLFVVGMVISAVSQTHLLNKACITPYYPCLLTTLPPYYPASLLPPPLPPPP